MTLPAGPEEVREPDFEAALRWARCRLKFGSPSGENETERDDNLARAYVALRARDKEDRVTVRRFEADIEWLKSDRLHIREMHGAAIRERDEALSRLAALQAAERGNQGMVPWPKGERVKA